MTPPTSSQSGQPIILCLAHEVKGMVWQRYDRVIRQAAASQPMLQWVWHELDVWLASFAEDGRAQGEGSDDSNSSNAKAQPPRRKRPVESATNDKVCFRWNRGECQGCTCHFAHKCLVCSSTNHPAKACPILCPQHRKTQMSARSQEGDKSLQDTSR